ncbi:MAG: hypothetical protein ACI9CO_000899 [Candidatus Azotimanducaceae bacterium]|jgi:hypothetical protein
MKFEGKRYQIPSGDVVNSMTYPFPELFRKIPFINNILYLPLSKDDGSYTEVVQNYISKVKRLKTVEWMQRALHPGLYKSYL